MKYESILEYSTRFDVKKMCEVLGVNRSSYYRWLKGQKKREERNLREKRDIEKIEKVFIDSDKIYGYRNARRIYDRWNNYFRDLRNLQTYHEKR